uniref:NADH-ubiquinone oxidoreductase chain 5 n=1 Tax=Cryptophyllium westwoodii TaxID=2778107 RepID=A0A7T8E6Y3_9NEOP|nr:NADH dehydrogenase subunit 5 [Cryptophyllium westwoodii]
MIWCYSFCLIFMFYFLFIGFFFFFLGCFFYFNDILYFIEYNFFTLNSVDFIMTLLFDWMSLFFMGLVFFISSLIIYYSESYMLGDFFFDRFIILVLLFVFSMMFMIVSPNLISILLGWDGLGLVSYCLVIYYQNINSFNSGMLTILSNRVGDSTLLMSISWMFNYGSWNYFMYIDFFSFNFDCSVISFLIFMSALTSSAQLPFSSWLPAAMAAPTPVSSLVHSSTLVTAGVYLLIRLNPLYVNTYLCSFLLFISLITMFMSGLCANFEFDLKSIIALSTLSQLGLMMFTISFGYIYMSYFHLLTHALFKASLFMCSGAIIHSFKDCQDIRFLGNLFFQMPFISICVIISSFCLCGLPFMSGFYSKDLILDCLSMNFFNLFYYFLFYFSMGLTVSYSFRLVYYLMISDFSFYSFHNCYDVNFIMLLTIFFMVFFSVFTGSLLMWILFPTPYLVLLPISLSVFILFVCFFGGLFGYYLIGYDMFLYILNYYLFKIFYFFGGLWFIPYLTISFPYFYLFSGLNISNIIDFGWLEFYGGQGVSFFLFNMSKFNQFIQNGSFNFFFIILSFWFIILFFF